MSGNPNEDFEPTAVRVRVRLHAPPATEAPGPRHSRTRCVLGSQPPEPREVRRSSRFRRCWPATPSQDGLANLITKTLEQFAAKRLEPEALVEVQRTTVELPGVDLHLFGTVL